MPVSELARVLEKESVVYIDGKYVAKSVDILDFMAEKR